MKKVKVYYSVENCGDGSAYPKWFLKDKDADIDQDLSWLPWGESCTGMVETYEGSNVHMSAVSNSAELKERLKEAKKNGYKVPTYV